MLLQEGRVTQAVIKTMQMERREEGYWVRTGINVQTKEHGIVRLW